MKGFFTQNRYFLLPEDCADVDELLLRYRGKSFAATELLEEKCMAPYFVSEHTQLILLQLREECAVYPCEVQVISMKEYNSRLHEILPSHCVGCPYYGGIDSTDDSLDGHHEEISLDRVCFDRAEAKALQTEGDIFDYYRVDEWINRFALRFATMDLEKIIDGGKLSRAAEIFCEALFEIVHCVIPPVWFRKNDEKYEFFCTTFTDEHDGLVMEYILKKLTELYGDTWNFYNYIPKGLDIAEAKKPLGVNIRYMQNVEPSLEMTVYVEKGFVNEAYYWLCSYLGERELQKLATPLNVVELAFEEELPEDTADAEILSDIFEELLPDLRYDEHRSPAPHVIFLSPRIGDADASVEEALADGGFYSFRASYLCDRFVMPIHLGEPLENIWEDCGTVTDLCMPIARIVFTDSPLDASRSADEEGERFKQDTAEFFDILAKDGLFLMFAQVTRNGTSEQFGLVLNHTELLYALRRAAPFFKKYPAELYVYTASHSSGGHYRLDYNMELLEEESLLWEYFENQ